MKGNVLLVCGALLAAWSRSAAGHAYVGDRRLFDGAVSSTAPELRTCFL